MNKSYERKEKFKDVLDKAGLLNIFGTIYGFRWQVRHLKCNVMAQKRSRGYLDKRYERLRSFAGKHEGERCFIICTGPSLTLEDVEKLKDEYTFALNSITKLFPKTDWRPNYYVIDDCLAYVKLEDELLKYDLKTAFSSDILIHELKPKVRFIAFPEDLLNHSLSGYHTTPKYAFSGDAYARVYGGFTVTFTSIQLAVYMGFKEIYLLGCDCNYSGEKTHFADYHAALQYVPNVQEQRMVSAYSVARRYADEHGIRIYNATRGGKLEVFERVDFDNVIATRVTNRGGVIRTAKYTGYCGSRTQDLILAA